MNLVKEYWTEVFDRFVAGLARGLTPNPDVLCNEKIKFGALFRHATSVGATLFATGHYAQIQSSSADGSPALLRAVDSNKDQTYFLAAISGTELARTLFPIGHLRKSEVREIAKQAGLCTAENPESMGICMVGPRRFRDFIKQYVPTAPGDFVSATDGTIVGRHTGLACYTVGQAARIGGQLVTHYVCGKNTGKNVVYVVPGNDHPLLFATELRATNARWIAGAPPAHLPDGSILDVQVRYRQLPVRARLFRSSAESAGFRLQFSEPVRAVTPGQAVVLYHCNVCLGCGEIADEE